MSLRTWWNSFRDSGEPEIYDAAETWTWDPTGVASLVLYRDNGVDDPKAIYDPDGFFDQEATPQADDGEKASLEWENLDTEGFGLVLELPDCEHGPDCTETRYYSRLPHLKSALTQLGTPPTARIYAGTISWEDITEEVMTRA